MNCFYTFVRHFLRVVLNIFFSVIDVEGIENIPTSGPVILAGNHPNGMVDPICLLAYSPRPVHLMGKDTLFHVFFFGWVMRKLGCVPVKRRQDHKGSKVDNTSAFNAVFDVLNEGECFGIFPEGISHDKSELQDLKSGIARIALGSIRRKDSRSDLRVVPVGLNYEHGDRFRGRVLIHFGPPIPIKDILKKTPQEEDMEHDEVKIIVGEVEEKDIDEEVKEKDINEEVKEKDIDEEVKEKDIDEEVKEKDIDEEVKEKDIDEEVKEKDIDEEVKEKDIDERDSSIPGQTVEDVVVIIEEEKVVENKVGLFDPEEVRIVMTSIEEGMRGVTVNTKDWELANLIHLSCKLYVPPKHSLTLTVKTELMRQFISVYSRISEMEHVSKVRNDVGEYRNNLLALRLKDEQIAKQYVGGCLHRTTMFMRDLIFVLILLPLAIPALLTNFPTAIFATIQSSKHKSSRDVIATYKLLCSFVLFPLQTIVEVILLGIFLDGILGIHGVLWALIFIIALPLFTYAAIRSSEEGTRAFKSLRATFYLLVKKEKRRLLLEQRTRLVREIGALVQAHAPTNPPPLFPSGSIPRSSLAFDTRSYCFSLAERTALLEAIQMEDRRKV